MLRIWLIAAAAALAFMSPAAAEELRHAPKAVVELFTSQGCSNCPPADAMLERMSHDKNIIALAYHVDYWDYRGWPDTFGSKANSDRQRDYATAWGSSRIFTPQMIVNGSEGVVASRPDEVEDAVQAAMLDLEVKLEPKGDMLKVSIPGDPSLGEAVIWIASFVDRKDVEIARGENEGKTVVYAQIVVHRQILGMWDPATGARLKLPLAEVMPAEANGVAVIVQQEKGGLPGPVLGAASYVTGN